MKIFLVNSNITFTGYEYKPEILIFGPLGHVHKLKVAVLFIESNEALNVSVLVFPDGLHLFCVVVHVALKPDALWSTLQHQLRGRRT